jgi:nucleoside-diphosphate-sugar epimerase
VTETVLVTGGTGFVAGWCIVQLRERGYAVRTTVRDPSRRAAIPADGVDVVVADLRSDEGWAEAVAGCDYVLHVASPLGSDGRGDPDALIDAAREGTLRVLRAAVDAGVKRVVMTSSTAAATPTDPGVTAVSDETVWTDPADRDVTPYRRSKILAERAAWDFMAGHPGATTLTTVLPVAIFGPVLPGGSASSVDIIQRLLAGRPPVLPRFGFTIVDVRDLADLHLRAMTSPDAAGERFIAAGEFRWLSEIAGTLRSRLGDRAAKVPTRGVPDGVVRFLARFLPPLRTLTPLLGRQLTFSSAKAKRVLGFAPRSAEKTIVDCAESLTPRLHEASAGGVR